MMKSLFALAFICIACVAQAQVTVFKTFEDFTNKNGETFDEYRRFFSDFGVYFLKVRKGKKSTKFRAKEIWGFSFKDALFRIDKAEGMPVRVLSVGKIIYYGNGFAHLDMVETGSNSSTFSFGYHAYVSKSLNSFIIPLEAHYKDQFYQVSFGMKLKSFREDYPEYEPLFDCIGGYYQSVNLIGNCVKEFEAGELEE